ncbi:MAG: glycine dehydrogenase subunit 2 [Gallionella sp.]|nr:MAG: glycine dehydrogenase subunit 2 [Gallionella sp.]
MLIFERSHPGRRNAAQAPNHVAATSGIPDALLRKDRPLLPEASEMDVVRHYTRLSQKNFSIDTHFYPLGSCTMKYNPRACNTLAMLPQFLARHPLAPDSTGQGVLACLYDLQEILKDVTGMAGVSLMPMAGAQGEFAGIAMIRAYHEARGDTARTEIIVPDAAHGTNPATAVMCGYTVKEIPTDSEGDVDLDALRAAVGPQTAGLMLTNPSTLGVFEKQIQAIQKIVHDVGGLLYYDGANLNAILGKVKPGDMGFDVIHMNLHKTFSTPHGGGGPGAGAVGVAQRLLPFLPLPVVAKLPSPAGGITSDSAGVLGQPSRMASSSIRGVGGEGSGNGAYRYLTEQDLPQSIGHLSAFSGNIGILLRAYVYARMLGAEGMHRVAEFATLNANYLMAELQKAGFTIAFPQRRASHEFIVSIKPLKDATGISAMDVAKRLLDKGYHPPTTYFPMLVPECLLIEPTETESKETLDGFVAAMKEVRDEAYTTPELVKGAPHTMPVRRLDDVKAARELDLTWKAPATQADAG